MTSVVQYSQTSQQEGASHLILRILLIVSVTLMLLGGPGLTKAQAFGDARGPHTVHPGHLTRFSARGFMPGSEVSVTIQPKKCLGSNGCADGFAKHWQVTGAGSVTVRFRFPKRYGYCTAVGCTNYHRFTKGTRAQVQLCDVQYSEGEGPNYQACAVKMVRIG